MKKYSIGILLLLVILINLVNPSSVLADTLTSSAPVTWNTGGQGSISVQVTAITGGGTITFNCTVDNSTYVAYNLTPVGGTTATTTTSSNGIWTGPLGPCNQFKLTISAGTATVTQRTIQAVKYLPGASGGGGGSGTVTQIDTTGPIEGGPITSTGAIACSTCGVTGSPLSQFAATTSLQLKGTISDETGSGLLVFATSPTFTTPILGTPTSGNLVNTTGYPVASLDNLGAGVATWLATPSSANLASAVTNETGSSLLVFNTSPTLVTPILGTPTSGDLSNTTNFPTANLSGLGTGVATWLATPNSANLAAAVTNETGSGALVFGTSPTFTTDLTLSAGTTTATSGTVTSNTQTGTANPSSTSTLVYRGLFINPTINYSAGTPGAGSYEALKIAVVETALPTGTNYLIRASAGAAGTTDRFTVRNGGTVFAGGTITTDGSFIGQQSGSSLILGISSQSILLNEAAYTLALRSTTNPQIFNIYNTFSSATNNEFFNILWATSVLHLGTNKGSGGGTARVMTLDYGGTTTSAISIPITSGSVTIGGATVAPKFLGNGTAPAVTNTSANSCGTTSATLVGTDVAGKVTVGATAGTSCTITFTAAFANAPSCTVSNETTANLSRATTTTTTAILAGTFVAGDVLAYHCLGY